MLGYGAQLRAVGIREDANTHLDTFHGGFSDFAEMSVDPSELPPGSPSLRA